LSNRLQIKIKDLEEELDQAKQYAKGLEEVNRVLTVTKDYQEERIAKIRENLNNIKHENDRYSHNIDVLNKTLGSCLKVMTPEQKIKAEGLASGLDGYKPLPNDSNIKNPPKEE
jgi:chromosome segregation ATPase